MGRVDFHNFLDQIDEQSKKYCQEHNLSQSEEHKLYKIGEQILCYYGVDEIESIIHLWDIFYGFENR